MLETRYEEYLRFTNDLPFKLTEGIKITPTTYSHEANWHDNLEIQLCTDGKGIVRLDEKIIAFQKNDVVLVNSNVIHHTNASDMIRYTCLIIDTRFCRQVDIDPLTLKFSPKIKSKTFLKHFKALCDIYENYEDICRIAKLNEILLKMLIELREKHTLSENKYAIKAHSFEAVKETIKFIRTNYERKMSLDEISQNAFMDKYSLSREFKKVTNQTIVQYINSYRCKKASEYISDGVSVADAAQMCGFTNMSFFTKTFKLYMGCLPSKYKVQ